MLITVFTQIIYTKQKQKINNFDFAVQDLEKHSEWSTAAGGYSGGFASLKVSP